MSSSVPAVRDGRRRRRIGIVPIAGLDERGQTGNAAVGSSYSHSHYSCS